MSEGAIAADRLRLLVERIERLEEEKKGIADDIKDVYAEAKGTGYDVKTLRAVIRLRKLERHVRQESQALLETYCAALGMDDMFAGHDGRAQREEPGLREAAGESITDALRRLDESRTAMTVTTGEGEVLLENEAAAQKNAGDADLYAAACLLVAEHQKASTSWLQRQLRIGYNSAAKLVERMEADSIVSAPNHVGKRDVLCTPDELELAAKLTALGVEPPLTRAAIATKLAERAVH